MSTMGMLHRRIRLHWRLVRREPIFARRPG